MTDFINFQSEIENVLVFYLKERVTTADKLAQKLIGPSATSKTFCFILRTSCKKTQLIPPLNVINKLVADFKEKARVFNAYFASKYRPIKNDSPLPRLVVLNSESSLSGVSFNNDDIL